MCSIDNPKPREDGKPGLQLEESKGHARSLPSLMEGGVLTLTILVSQALAAPPAIAPRKTELVAVTVKVKLWADATSSLGEGSHSSSLGKLGRG